MMKKLSGEQEERRETLNTREAGDSYKRVLSRSTIFDIIRDECGDGSADSVPWI